MNGHAKTTSQDALGGTGFVGLCAAGLPFLCIASFALAYLHALVPALVGIGSIGEARHLFDSVCMSLPHAVEDMFTLALGSPIGGG